ncbi:MAG TPA: hypothetical protein VMG58_15325, partial [Candidatus Sulfotelmatobacter sp.]|nr:hypothetical protein [Candidatus Sulfotelmatobacter sp.]
MAIDQAGDRSKLGRSPHIWSAALTLSILAIALRILVASRREGIEIDGILYLQNARALLTDWRSINAIHPPLYSLLLAPFLPFA